MLLHASLGLLICFSDVKVRSLLTMLECIHNASQFLFECLVLMVKQFLSEGGVRFGVDWYVVFSEDPSVSYTLLPHKE